jgi:CheY-like chemotaxis protein
VQAKNGFEVLQMLMRGSRYGAILIMNNLPIMSGIDTVRKIQEKIFNETYIQPIIPIFEPHEDEAATICQSLDIQQWLFKPVRQEDLYLMLAKVKS